jgi:hypothetical protein
MVSRLTFLFACGLTLLAVGQDASAQEARAREGFWWGVGLSYGWAHVSCDICVADRKGNLSATVNLGGTISQSFLLGGELNGWMRGGEENVDEYMASMSGVAYWYPKASGSLYLKGGFAYMTYRISDDEEALTSSGFGPQIGVGYEFRITRHASIQPYLNAIVTFPTSDLDIDGNRQASDVSLSLIQFGLGLTWH